MDNNNIMSFPNKETTSPKEEEDEEVLSLCDFPLSSDEEDNKTHRHRRSPSHPLDFFEFFNDVNSDDTMSHAEDIISGGKLVPYKPQQQQQPSLFDDQILKYVSGDHNHESKNLSLRFSESFPAEMSPRRSNGSEGRRLMMRSSRSLDSQKLNSSKSEQPSDIRRSFSNGSSKPRWCSLVFGPMKFQPEMDLRDMKQRQVRRNSGRMFPAIEGGGGRSPVNQSDRRSSSWGYDLLRILSCRDYSNVDVTTSVGLVRQV